MRIGIAGLGRMGGAIAARLIEVGHQVTVWNRSPAKAKALGDAGAKVAATPSELAHEAEAVITILTDAAAIDTVYGGPSGLLSADVKGKLFIEMSTVQPQTEIALAAKVRGKGAAFVECPVGGTTGPARQGKLIGLMGGEPADTQRALPIMEQLCRRVQQCGPVGNGSTMKLAINLPLMIYWQAFGEALALARPLGIDPNQMIDLFADTSGGTNVLKARGSVIATMLKGDDAGPVTFDIDSGRKDLHTMLAEGERRGISMPLIERTLACFDEASRNGWGAKDASSLPVYWSGKTA